MFRAGQPVWSLRQGAGVVTVINDNGDLKPVVVEFLNGQYRHYRHDGRVNPNDLNPDLYANKPKKVWINVRKNRITAYKSKEIAFNKANGLARKIAVPALIIEIEE